MNIEKKIIGRWVDIRNNSSNFYKLTDFFGFEQSRYEHIISNLEFSVEEGIIEYKRTSLLPVFRLLEDLKFKAITFSDLDVQKKQLDELLFVILLQRLLASGSLRIPDSDTREGISVESIEIGTILKDILSRIKENPEIKSHPAVKNILVQFTIYKNEKQTMNNLLKTMKNKPTSTFYENFKSTFSKIFASIRKNYGYILKEDASKTKKKNILMLVPIKEAGPILYRQAKEISKISTCFDFAKTERYKIRGILLPVLRAKDPVLSRIVSEHSLYKKWGKELQETAAEYYAEQISLRFNREIIEIIKKLSEKNN